MWSDFFCFNILWNSSALNSPECSDNTRLLSWIYKPLAWEKPLFATRGVKWERNTTLKMSKREFLFLFLQAILLIASFCSVVNNCFDLQAKKKKRKNANLTGKIYKKLFSKPASPAFFIHEVNRYSGTSHLFNGKPVRIWPVNQTSFNK